MIPSYEECLNLLSKYSFPKEKIKHVRLVAGIAKYFAQKITEKRPGVIINSRLLEAASLLHDIDKNIPKREGEKHPMTGARILTSEGCGEVSEVVLKHDIESFLDTKRSPKTWEEKILVLADKMAKNEIVTVGERYKLWYEENIAEQNKILDETYPFMKKLETFVFGIIGMTSDEVKSELRQKEEDGLL